MKKGESVESMTGNKWKIFKVAVELFSTKGYSNVGVRDIAKELASNHLAFTTILEPKMPS